MRNKLNLQEKKNKKHGKFKINLEFTYVYPT